MTFHGAPCWFELTTADSAAAQGFYGAVLGWTYRDAGMEDFPYILASAGDDMIAGFWQPDEPMPHFWMVYFAVTDCDGTCARLKELGGKVFKEPADIPGTGRFAVVTDPQGAAFGILQPQDGQSGHAFDQAKPGHGNWVELSSTEPLAGLAFYAKLFGWTGSRAMPMGEMGDYQIFAHQGQDIGGMMRVQLPGVPSHWLPYFGAPSIKAAMAAVTGAGGTVLHGPQEVPGGAFICVGQDPQGVHFALVGGA